jgi:hypothetical protein
MNTNTLFKILYKQPLYKKYLGYYIIWAFLHLVFLAIGWNGEYHDKFWPSGDSYYSIKRVYDFSEFLVYVLGPVVLLFGLSFIIWGGVEDKIDKEIKKRS